TRISIETFDRGTRSAREAAELMASVLGWDKDQIEREVQHYEKRVEAERESQRQPDDLTADAARLGAPDIVPRWGIHSNECRIRGSSFGIRPFYQVRGQNSAASTAGSRPGSAIASEFTRRVRTRSPSTVAAVRT